MSESLSSPWIVDYLIDIAETYGAQLYNAPLSTKKRRAQLTDFLTYQEDSYIWAWISDKEYKVSVRISKAAVDQYNSTHSSPILNCRFYPVFIGNYRPMFAPRPLGSNVAGNTSVSHLSLEVGFIKQIGPGNHPFGSPRDLELNEKLKPWILGLRQDGGGGNVLKLRKQEERAQSKNPPASPKHQPRLLEQVPVSPKLAAQVMDIAPTKPSRPQDFRRAYDKRWRTVEVDPWKFAFKPEPPKHVEIAPLPIEQPRQSVSEAALEMQARTPSPDPVSSPGTPSHWSPSNRGSPIPPYTHGQGDGEQEQESDKLLASVQLPSDADGHITTESMAVVTSQETSSVQPPTPAQRIKRSPPPRLSSPRSSPERFIHSPRPSQQLSSSPLLPSSSLPLPSSSFQISVGIRKNIQRKVPRPEIPLPRPGASKDGPAQILVPNSDTSGTASSQSYSQSQHPSQSQQSQFRSQSHAPAFPSSLAKEFKPPHESTPKVQTPRRTSKMSAEASSALSDIEEQGAMSADDTHTVDKDEESPMAPRARKTRSNERRSAAPSDTTGMTSQSRASRKRRLVNFLVDFEEIDLGDEAPMPKLDWDRDVLNSLLRTGRIRTLGNVVLQNGSVYIDQE